MKLKASGLPLAAACCFVRPCTRKSARVPFTERFSIVKVSRLQGAVVRVEHLTTHQTDDAKTSKNGGYALTGLFQGQYKITDR